MNTTQHLSVTVVQGDLKVDYKDMLTAYYSCSCDSEELFEGLEISRKSDFKKHLNKYDVIHLDVQWCMMDAGSPENTVAYMNEHLISELQEIYPDIVAG